MMINCRRVRYFTAPNANYSDHSSVGFTLTEVVAVMAIMTILGAIAVPKWLSFLNTYTLNMSQEQAFQIVHQTQSDAKRLHIVRQASFRELNGSVQQATHPANRLPIASEWQNLPAGTRIDTQETTLASNGGVYKMQFDQEGNANGQLGRLTFVHQNGGRARRCIIISTLVGLVRKGENRATPDQSGRSCY